MNDHSYFKDESDHGKERFRRLYFHISSSGFYSIKLLDYHMSTLEKYVHAFKHLNRGVTRYGLAPHKPILLLSLIDLVEKDLVTDNRFEINTNLINTFKENWQLLVTTANLEDLTQPFYHLQHDTVNGYSFWNLQPKSGYRITAPIKSLTRLATYCAYGFFGEELWLLLADAVSRNFLRQTLLSTYFPEQQLFYCATMQVGRSYIQRQTESILNEPSEKYGKRRVYTTEEMIVRDGLFQRWVTSTYQYQCSFTGMKLNNTFNYAFIDACHIIPFAISFNDNHSNGLALCPNMHRAFDRGLLSVDIDYRILVSDHVDEEPNHPYALAHLEGKPMTLPDQKELRPSQEALEWHRVEVFKV